MRFIKESVISASAESVFAFHDASDAFARLLPPWLGALGRVFGGAFARRQLDRLFAYRHEVTGQACEQSDP